MSRPHFNVTMSFLLSSSLLLGHSFSFMLRHPSVFLSFQAGHDSNCWFACFSCRDVDMKSRPSIFFNHCNSCRDLTSRTRPYFLPIQSQPLFSVSTVPFTFSISGRDLNSMSRHHLCCKLCWSLLRSQFHVTTWLFLFLAEIYVATLKACRDINFAHPVATSLLSHDISNCTSHLYCRDINFRSRPGLESPTYIFVAT